MKGGARGANGSRGVVITWLGKAAERATRSLEKKDVHAFFSIPEAQLPCRGSGGKEAVRSKPVAQDGTVLDTLSLDKKKGK